MAKKTFAHSARVVRGAARWYIDYWRLDADTGRQTRHRHDFDLNDIENPEVREAVAQRLVKYIDALAPGPRAAATKPADVDIAGTTLSFQAAVAYVRDQKMQLPRKSSRSTYRTVSHKLLNWARAIGYADMPVRDFSRKYARAFWQHVQAAGQCNGRTLNNYLSAIRTMWEVMLSDEHVQENPWKRIRPERAGEKRRRAFTPDERRLVAAEIERRDYWLFRALLLQYFCYVRPVEQTRLRFRDFDLGLGLLTVRENDSKSYAKRVITIPASVMKYFRDGVFERFPGNYYVFGCEAVRPGVWKMGPGKTPINEGRMYKRHRRMLEQMRADGVLKDIDGLTWYSWKDTGISVHTRKTSPVATKDQAGHASLNITSTYYHPEPVNQEYRELENDLL